MGVALFVAGALGMPVTGLLVRPEVRGARHDAEMIVDLGRGARSGCHPRPASARCKPIVQDQPAPAG